MGVCTSAGATVQHSDDDNAAESIRISERDTAIKQHIENLEHHIADLTSKIQQLEVNVTNKDEQVGSLKKELGDVKEKLENDLTALRTDFEYLQSELQRKPTSNSITILHADTVNASDAATNHFTASEMQVDNSNLQTVHTKEKHISVNENTKTRTHSTDQIPKPRPNWKLSK
ncbi:uncharacterized protein LOC110457102 [Mizuhopecten yessoensis]|uniref:uncharacterized protein LOC110457102 n=1 Tax=Mizuhopecten yessoensis TaxID=6573 RepID=UPI000B45D1DF|nr:uncharacterized protein LOC110457102 [Mizuhopecten yessoensis]